MNWLTKFIRRQPKQKKPPEYNFYTMNVVVEDPFGEIIHPFEFTRNTSLELANHFCKEYAKSIDHPHYGDIHVREGEKTLDSIAGKRQKSQQYPAPNNTPRARRFQMVKDRHVV